MFISNKKHVKLFQAYVGSPTLVEKEKYFLAKIKWNNRK